MRLGNTFIVTLKEMDAIIQIAKEQEREACAKVAESYEPRCDSCPRGVATAIRARGIDAAIVGEVGIWGEKPPVKSYCGGKPNYCTPEQGNNSPNYPISESSIPFVDAVNMSQERVDETAKGEQEPVAWMYEWGGRTNFTTTDQRFVEAAHPHFVKSTPLYTAPPKREWVGLTDADKQEAFDETQEASGGFWEFADYLEAKLKEKNA